MADIRVISHKGVKLLRSFLNRIRGFHRRAGNSRDEWRLAGGPVIVIAPHPDDEVIGCGGTMFRHGVAGDEVTVIFLTRGEGSLGFPWLSAEERAQTREAEARSASIILGVHETVFLDGLADDQDATAMHGFADQLLSHLIRVKPKIIFIPYWMDKHPIHRFANWLIADLAQKTDELKGTTICAYEVWSTVPANYVVDVTDCWRKKIKAIKLYRLALDIVDYKKIIKAINTYRAITMLGTYGYAEAFLRLSLEDYLESIAKVSPKIKHKI